MDAVSNNKLANTENQLKDFLQTVLSSEGIVVDIRRTFIEYNGVNRSRAFARHANRMASKGTDEKFVVIALMCYPALQWIIRAQDIDKVIDELREQNADETICRMSNIQRMLESSVGCAKPQLRLEMRKVFFARCQELVDAVDDAMNKAVFLNPQSKPSKISLAMAMMRGSILESDPVSAVAIRNNFDSIVEDVTKVGSSTIKPLVMELAPNEGEAQSAEASFLFHNTEVLLREYSRIANPSIVDENRSVRIDSKLYDVLQLVVNEKYGANGTDEAKLAEQVGINSSYFSEKKHRAFTALSALLWGCDIESLLSLLQ